MKFNRNTQNKTVTTNLAGGVAYKQSDEVAFVSFILTSLLKDQSYRNEGCALATLQEFVRKLDPKFVCKAAVYARHEFGVRSVSHAIAGEILLQRWQGSGIRDFLTAVVKRPDDIMEIMAYYMQGNTGKVKVTNAMRKGLGAAFAKFDEYQLAKYKGEGKEVSLIDCVRILHPKEPKGALKKLVHGTLTSPNTWESRLSSGEDKDRVWYDLLSKNKLGYMAALRNIRNIAVQSPDAVGMLINLLVDKERIKKSLVFPYRYLSAYEAIQDNADIDPTHLRYITTAIASAVEFSVDNVPKFEGRILVALDESYSMVRAGGRIRSGEPLSIGAIFASALYKTNNTDLMVFSDDARYVTPLATDGVLSIANNLRNNARPGGTNFTSIIRSMRGVYDRIIILSDMQSWSDSITGDYFNKHFRAYKEAKHVDTILYSFDLTGYGTMQAPEKNVYCIAGYSDKVFSIMEKLEQDKNALVNTIKEYKYEG